MEERGRPPSLKKFLLRIKERDAYITVSWRKEGALLQGEKVLTQSAGGKRGVTNLSTGGTQSWEKKGKEKTGLPLYIKKKKDVSAVKAYPIRPNARKSPLSIWNCDHAQGPAKSRIQLSLSRRGEIFLRRCVFPLEKKRGCLKGKELDGDFPPSF